jgi:xylulokinase
MSLLGIDVGTTGCKVIALSANGQIIASAEREYHVLRPQPGWAELDSAHVWEQIQACIRQVAAQTAHDPIVALSVSSMGESMTPVSQNREILGNCILGFDVRGEEAVQKLLTIDERAFLERSGNLVGGVMGGPKLIWLRDNRPDLFARTWKFLGWADFVNFMLGGAPVIDYGLANRIFFFDLRGECWSTETLDFIGMPVEKLPDLAQSGTLVGTVSAAAAESLGLPPGVKIVAGAHDQGAGAMGSGVIRPGLATCTMGTFITLTPAYHDIPPMEQIHAARLNVEHHPLPGLYVSFYWNLTGGALLKWFRDTFCALEHAQAEAQGRNVYDALLAEMPAQPTRLMMLPHFAQTGPPYYDDKPYGLIGGLTLETTRGEFLKGLLEGMTYYYREGIDIMARANIPIDELRANGGGARSDAWLQLMADMLGVPLARPKITEATALGAAILAGVGAGVYHSAAEAVDTLVKIDRRFEPDMGRYQQYGERFAKYPLLYPFAQKLRDS